MWKEIVVDSNPIILADCTNALTTEIDLSFISGLDSLVGRVHGHAVCNKYQNFLCMSFGPLDLINCSCIL
jgi:hypothetical protein